jgi:hypothetical protein
MAALRCLTAEEESASALFYALKRRRYPRATELDNRSHFQKLAVSPFLRAFGRLAANAPKASLALVAPEPPRRPHLDVIFQDPATAEEFHFAPPLHFSASLTGTTRSLPTAATILIAKAYRVSSLPDLFRVLRRRTKQRTQFLYACKQGTYSVAPLSEAQLAHSQRGVLRDLKLVFLIDPIATIQSLPVQVLDAFFEVLAQAPRNLRREEA